MIAAFAGWVLYSRIPTPIHRSQKPTLATTGSEHSVEDARKELKKTEVDDVVSQPISPERTEPKARRVITELTNAERSLIELIERTELTKLVNHPLRGGPQVPDTWTERPGNNIIKIDNQSGQDATVWIFQKRPLAVAAQVWVPDGGAGGVSIKDGLYYLVARYGLSNGSKSFIKSDSFTIDPPAGKFYETGFVLRSTEPGGVSPEANRLTTSNEGSAEAIPAGNEEDKFKQDRQGLVP